MIDHIWNEEDIVMSRMDYGYGPEPVDGLRWTCLACGRVEEREKNNYHDERGRLEPELSPWVDYDCNPELILVYRVMNT
jgi:hypothetical protein